MAKLNVKVKPEPIRTGGGGIAVRINAKQQLERLCLATMLWEDNFYVDGKTTAQFIADVLPSVSAEDVVDIAIQAREEQKLRHIPLYLLRELARRKNLPAGILSSALERVIQRPDELTEFLAIYWKDNANQPLSAQVKKGLAAAFRKFDAYQLSKWDKEGAIKLRDVVFLTHAKPTSKQEKTFAQLVNRSFYPVATKSAGHSIKLWAGEEFQKLAPADTWETRLSNAGGSGAKTKEQKKDTWSGLLDEPGKLGAMALLKNLRNMTEAGVDEKKIRAALLAAKTDRILPFRFMSAAKYNPRLEDALEQTMFKCLAAMDKLPGKTILIVDVSGSMYWGGISGQSELKRSDAAAALAVLVREVCEHPVVYATAGSDGMRRHKTELIPARRGFGLASLISSQSQLCQKLGGGGIFLTQVMEYVHQHEKDADRVIVITDEQDCDSPDRSPSKALTFGTHNYIINVSAEKNGIGYGNNWMHINGWSEAVVSYIQAVEKARN